MCLMPDCGCSAGIGSVQTETICVMRRSVKERVDCAETRLKIGKESYEIRVMADFKNANTDFPKKSRPSMMGLTFLKPI